MEQRLVFCYIYSIVMREFRFCCARVRTAHDRDSTAKWKHVVGVAIRRTFVRPLLLSPSSSCRKGRNFTETDAAARKGMRKKKLRK